MLPFRPQSIEELRTRYPTIMGRVFDCRRGTPSPRPGELYSHIFDCDDGIRLIISRDRETDSEVFLHVSASFVKGYPLWDTLKGSGEAGQQIFIKLVEERFRKLSDDEQPLDFQGFSTDKQVPHWRRKES